jgi:predicted ATPase/DNA-binding winged helix-turn-helix (wHTH) protein
MTSGADPQHASERVRQAVEFGPFRYDPLRRVVHAPGGPLRIGSRALELLGVLLEAPGRLYSREELVSRVWQRSVVEETSLRVHMSALRRQLGEGPCQPQYITNVPGRGYAFTAPVRPSRDDHAPGACEMPSRRVPDPHLATLNAPLGREEVLAGISTLLDHARLVSLVGPAGVGKTTVVKAAATSLDSGFRDGTAFADFTGVNDARGVAPEVCRAIGLPSADPGALEDALRERHMLIVLDHCEHVIDAVAALVERLMHRCSGLRFILCGCEPLQVGEEWIYRLRPLAMPDAQVSCSLEELKSYPAIRLFDERARARSVAFSLSDRNAAAVRRICTLLDGVPLALELAAAQVAQVGVRALAASCEGSLALLSRGRRNASPRHRSLHASLAWSCSGLTASEREVLQRLSALPGDFSLREAIALLSGPDRPDHGAMDDVLNLCTRSLLHRQGPGTAEPRYRLFHAMRLFAQEQAPDGAGRRASDVAGWGRDPAVHPPAQRVAAHARPLHRHGGSPCPQSLCV